MKYHQCEKCGMVIGEGAKWDTHAPGCTGGAIHEVITVRVGSREWAIVQTMTGHSICHRSDPKLLIENPAYILINCTGPGHEHMADGWSLYKPEPPPWKPKEGDEVRWQCGKHSGTGVYHQLASSGRHLVKVRAGGPWFGVTSVSPLEESEEEPKPPPITPGTVVRDKDGELLYYVRPTGTWHEVSRWPGECGTTPRESVTPLLMLERHPLSEPPPVVGKRYLVGWKSGTMQTVTTPEHRWPDGIAWWAEVPREESDG